MHKLLTRIASLVSHAILLGMLLVQNVASAEWDPANLGEIDSTAQYKRVEKEISFQTNGPIEAQCSYPILTGQGVLIEHVNEQLKTAAEARLDSFVREELFSEEPWEDGCTLSYDLTPVYQTPELSSVFGSRLVCRGVHGCTYYEGKNFWQRGNSVIQLALDDLFLPGSGYRSFLLRHCEDYFKSIGYGYYSSRKEFPPELTLDDLDIFTLSDKGLLITFRAYLVGGWADGPDQVLIPYTELKKFIDPHGPLGHQCH